jgi:hypothetical protein
MEPEVFIVGYGSLLSGENKLVLSSKSLFDANSSTRNQLSFQKNLHG